MLASKKRPKSAKSDQKRSLFALATMGVVRACHKRSTTPWTSPNDVLLLLGQAEFQLGHFSRAESLVREFLKLEPTSVSAQRTLGCVLQVEGRLVEAAGWLFQSFTSAKKVEWALYQMSLQASAAGRHSEAVHLMSQAMALCPGDEKLYSAMSSFAKSHKEADSVVSALKMLGLQEAATQPH